MTHSHRLLNTQTVPSFKLQHYKHGPPVLVFAVEILDLDSGLASGKDVLIPDGQ